MDELPMRIHNPQENLHEIIDGFSIAIMECYIQCVEKVLPDISAYFHAQEPQ